MARCGGHLGAALRLAKVKSERIMGKASRSGVTRWHFTSIMETVTSGFMNSALALWLHLGAHLWWAPSLPTKGSRLGTEQSSPVPCGCLSPPPPPQLWLSPGQGGVYPPLMSAAPKASACLLSELIHFPNQLKVLFNFYLWARFTRGHSSPT